MNTQSPLLLELEPAHPSSTTLLARLGRKLLLKQLRQFEHGQIRLIEPRVVATLGNFATKLLTGDQTGITKVHGKPQVKTLGSRTVFLLPLFHPAAGLRARGTAELLAADINALPALLGRDLPEQELQEEAP